MATTATAAERIGKVAQRLSVAKETRKRFRLRIIPNALDGRPAPFYGVTIAGFNFAERTERLDPDPRNESRDIRTTQDGQIVTMTPSDVERLRAGIDRYIVRWTNRSLCIAQVIDSDMLDGKNPETALNPETDEPIAPWLLISEIA